VKSSISSGHAANEEPLNVSRERQRLDAVAGTAADAYRGRVRRAVLVAVRMAIKQAAP